MVEYLKEKISKAQDRLGRVQDSMIDYWMWRVNEAPPQNADKITEFTNLHYQFSIPIPTNPDQARAQLEDLDEAWSKVWSGVGPAINIYSIPDTDMNGVVVFPREKDRGRYERYVLESLKKEYESVKVEIEIVVFNFAVAKLTNSIRKINIIDPKTKIEQGRAEVLSKKDFRERLDDLDVANDEVITEGLLEVSDNHTKLDAMKLDLASGVNEARERIQRYLSFSERVKSPEELELHEIVDELIAQRADPFFWKEWKTAPDGRTKNLVNEFIRRVGSSEGDGSDPEKELNRFYYKVLVQIGTLDAELQHEDQKASTDRSNLYTELKKRILTRRELLMVTYRDDYGWQVRDILDGVIKAASLRNDEDGYNPNLSYYVLAGEEGRAFLSNEIKKIYGKGGKGYEPEAIRMADYLFTGFDMLGNSLRELQKMTQTGAHNQGVKDVDHSLAQDPSASMIHRAFRYGGNDMDWSLWWLFYMKDVTSEYTKAGITHSDPHKWSTKDWKKLHEEVRYGRTPDNLKRIWEIQTMVKAHQNASFDISGIGGELPLTKPLETYFPGSDGYVRMFKGESMWRLNDYIDHNGIVLATKVRVGNEYIVVNPTAISGDSESPIINPSGILLIEDDGGNIYDKSRTKVGNKDQIKFLIHSGEIKGFKHTRTKEVFTIQPGVSVDVLKKRATELSYGGSLYPVDQYENAEGGWLKLLEFAFKDLGVDPNKGLTRTDILGKAGESKGGILHQWYSAAGRAKMFPGTHLEKCLVPMLTHFIIRLFQRVHPDMAPKYRAKLFEDVERSLIDSSEDGGGLAGYTNQIREVIALLKDDKDGYLGMSRRLFPGSTHRGAERRKYLELWYEEEILRESDIDDGRRPPSRISEFLPIWAPGVAEDKNDFFDKLNNYEGLPLPVTRDGDMYAKSEGSSSGE